MGSMEFVTNENKSKERSKEDNSSQSPINYPVGKPLEVSVMSGEHLLSRYTERRFYFYLFLIVRSIWLDRTVHRPVTYSEPSTP